MLGICHDQGAVLTVLKHSDDRSPAVKVTGNSNGTQTDTHTHTHPEHPEHIICEERRGKGGKGACVSR